MKELDIASWLQANERPVTQLVPALLGEDPGKAVDALVALLALIPGGAITGAVAGTLSTRLRAWARDNDPTKRLLLAEKQEHQSSKKQAAVAELVTWLLSAVAGEVSAAQSVEHRQTRDLIYGFGQIDRADHQTTHATLARIAAVVETGPASLPIDQRLTERFDVVRGHLQGDDPGAARRVLIAIDNEHLLRDATPAARLRWFNQSGIAALELGELDIAASHLEKALAIEPKSLHALINLAVVNFVRGNASTACDLSRRATMHHPEDASAWAVRVQCCRRPKESVEI